MSEIYLSVLKDPLADGALVVLVLEASLFMEIHVRLCSAKVLAAATTNSASQMHRVQVRVRVVLAHVQFVVALEPERL